MLKTIKQKAKVITRRDDPQPFTPFPDQEPEHITVLNCISADGDHLKPLIIFPLKTMPPLQPQVREAFLISGQSSGWMTSAAFQTYIEQFFVPQIVKKRKDLRLPPSAPALLLYDGASVHFGVDVDFIRSQYNLHIHLLFPNSSAITQPLDVGVHGVFKQKLSKLFKYQEGEGARARRNRLCVVGILALSEALTMYNILTGFAKSGINPLDPTIPLQSGMIKDELIPLEPPAPRGGPLGVRIDDGIVESDTKVPFSKPNMQINPLASLNPNIVSSSSAVIKS